MNLEIIAVYRNLGDYIAGLENGTDSAEALWEKYAIEPYWKTLCRYTQEDLSYRKPRPVTDIASLKKQIEVLNQIDLHALKGEFEKVVSALPNNDDDPMYIALYPASDKDVILKNCQNGVGGTSTYGNMFILLNPFAENFPEWIPYVFAHEYHHNIWGSYWFIAHGGELENLFLNSLLIDGEADSFALSLYPKLKPKWLFEMSVDAEKSLWKDHYSKIILKPEQEVDYRRYMFGDASCGIPWCAGYAIGYRIVRQFLRTNPGTTIRRLIEMRPLEIYNASGYDPLAK